MPQLCACPRCAQAYAMRARPPHTPAHMRPTARRVRTQVREHLDAEADYERGRQGLEEVRRYGENEAHLAEQSGLHHAADWPRMAEAWGCALGPI